MDEEENSGPDVESGQEGPDSGVSQDPMAGWPTRKGWLDKIDGVVTGRAAKVLALAGMAAIALVSPHVGLCLAVFTGTIVVANWSGFIPWARNRKIDRKNRKRAEEIRRLKELQDGMSKQLGPKGPQAPGQQAPTQQAPTQQAPTQQAPAQQAPAQPAPATDPADPASALRGVLSKVADGSLEPRSAEVKSALLRHYKPSGASPDVCALSAALMAVATGASNRDAARQIAREALEGRTRPQTAGAGAALNC